MAAVALVLAGQSGDSKTNDNLTLPGTGSTAATELLEDNLPEQAYGSNPLVFQAKGGAVLTAPKYASAIGQTVKRLSARLPRWTPHISIEGEDFFAKRDAA